MASYIKKAREMFRFENSSPGGSEIKMFLATVERIVEFLVIILLFGGFDS